MDKVIDGVDVSGCEFAVKVINDNRIKCHCAKGLLQIAKMQEQPESIKSGLCENNPNCYYKQLQRLKKENYQLQKDCQICENFIDFIPCKPIRDMDYDLQKVISQRDNYYQALQKIIEICKNSHTSANEDFYRTADKIQDKINEVIGAEE